ncbi:MAG: hydrogenase expression/formation protein HypE [Candidatus Kapabacteria bacterium]|nr:hydrogenase expression/formation protein HypE [Candidatus Kapabacteria bacterium]
MNTETNIETLSCPLPFNNYEKVLLAHGSGGTFSGKLINDIFLKYFDNPHLNELHDGAVVDIPAGKLAFSTDSYVVDPIFFPDSNIGDLAVNGTVNDLSCCGAKPLYLSAGFILEEGFPIKDLEKIVISMKNAAVRAGVSIITGDTKVVNRGKVDKIFINTAGVGFVYEGINISPKNCRAGDVIILNGAIASHGIAIMSEREGFEFESKIKSDSAPLNELVENICKISKNIHVLRDPTRGGLASALNEIAMSSGLGMYIEENQILIDEQVKGVCEMLGFDPLYVANEGKIIVIVSAEDADKILYEMRKNILGADSNIIGRVTSDNKQKVIMKTCIGTNRIVDMLSGEQLPRIC